MDEQNIGGLQGMVWQKKNWAEEMGSFQSLEVKNIGLA